MENRIQIDASKCTGCMLCVQAGFAGDFKSGPSGMSEVADAEAICIECGHCVAVCPSGAITVSAFDGAEFSPMSESDRPSYDQLLSFLKMRRSRREFKRDPIPNDVIDKLLIAAVQAPTAMNRQTVEYHVIISPDIVRGISNDCAKFLRSVVQRTSNPIGRFALRLIARDAFSDVMRMRPKMDQIAAAYESGRDTITYNAPCVILLHAAKSDSMASVNAAYHSANILLAAETLGLGACVIGFVTEAAALDTGIKRRAQIPEHHAIHSTIAIGYPKFRYKRSIPKKSPSIKYI